MTPAKLGVREAISFALGGIIGGGIFAVLGVVAAVAGPTAWIAYLLAGIVVMATGYSYVKLNALSARTDGSGGAVSFIAEFLDRPTVAGMVGWTLLVGYIGSMAMYAFAFGEFTAAFGVVPTSIANVPIRPLISVMAVAGFVGLNLLGAQTTGTTENVLVALKVGILVVFGLLGMRSSLAKNPVAIC